jgi:Lhr-like helicase
MKRYEHVVHEFQKFFDQDALSKILETKIDNQQLLKETNTKVSKKDFQQFLDV